MWPDLKWLLWSQLVEKRISNELKNWHQDNKVPKLIDDEAFFLLQYKIDCWIIVLG